MADKILVLGGVSYNLMVYLDHFPGAEPGTVYADGYHETVGSTGAGKALNLSRLGLDIVLHGLIGADREGEQIQAALDRPGIHFLYDVDPAGSQRHVNLMNAAGERISIFIEPGTLEPAVSWAPIQAALAESELLVLNIRNYARAAIPLARALGKPIWCDIHDYDGEAAFHRDFIEAADVLFLSSERLPDYRAFMEAQIAAGRELVICTHGRGGATALAATGEWFTVPIVDAYERKDTNGAGDAFFSGVLYGRLQGYKIRHALALGAIVAGMCVTVPELVHPDLSPETVEEAYQQHFLATPPTED